MIRNISAVDIFGIPIPSQNGPFPISRGMQFMVAGLVYPENTLNSCTYGSPCIPNVNPIGNFICTAWALADVNSTGVGQALSNITDTINITELPYKGTIIASGLETSAFSDTVTTLALATIGSTGSFINVGKETQVKSLGLLGGPGLAPGLKVGLRITFNFKTQNSQ
jgi:hypothetical protein